MDNTAVRLGNNIKLLRKAHGDTQETLADIIGVGITALSNYENGRRYPDDNILNAIAYRYQCPMDQLKTDDFSFLETTSTVLTKENLSSLIEVALPILQIDDPNKDLFFTKGYEHTKEVVANMKTGDGDMMYHLEKASDAYETSLKESKTIESAANLLVLLFVLQIMLLLDDYIDDENESIQHSPKEITAVNKFIPRISKKYSFEDAKDKCELLRYIRKDSARYTLMLKKTREYSNLSDYYIALRHVCLIDKSGFGQDFDRIIGLEMMKTFMRFGNKYAKAYIKTLEKALHD